MKYFVRRNTSNILTRQRIFRVSCHFSLGQKPHGQLSLIKFSLRLLSSGQLPLNNPPLDNCRTPPEFPPGQLLPGPLAPGHFSVNNSPLNN